MVKTGTIAPLPVPTQEYEKGSCAPCGVGVSKLALAVDNRTADSTPCDNGFHQNVGKKIWRLFAVMLLSVIVGCSQDPNYTVPGLTKMLQDSDPGMRYTAAKTLGSYGTEATSAVPQLVQALKDPDTSVRIGAAYALAEIGPSAESAVPTLAEGLNDKDVEIRLAAVYAISVVGVSTPIALPLLQPLKRDRDFRVRDEVTKAIRKLEAAAKYRQSAPTNANQKNAGRQP